MPGLSPGIQGSYLRGSVWLLKDDPQTAAVFFKHAVEQDPTNEQARSAWIQCLKLRSGRSTALTRMSPLYYFNV